MDRERLAEIAADLKNNHGYNCAQSVTVALGDETGLTEQQLNQVAAGFAVGMGNMEATCGSLIGAVIIAGLKTGGVGSVRMARQISDRFRELSGAITCKTLKGKDGSGLFCPCDECVRNAVRAYCDVMEAWGLA